VLAVYSISYDLLAIQVRECQNLLVDGLNGQHRPAPRNLDRHYKALLRRAGLPNRRLHDLRHTFATLLFRRGLDVTMISRMLGHASIQITIDIYIHWLPKDSSEAATIGDAFLRGRGEKSSTQ